eukprot:157542_1
MSTTYRCIICHKDLKSSSEKKRRKCNSCIHKKSTASTAIASVASVAAGAAIGFIGGYVASLWSDKNNTPKIKEETKQNNEIDTTMYDPHQDIASSPICYDSRVNIAYHHVAIHYAKIVLMNYQIKYVQCVQKILNHNKQFILID